MKLNFIKKISIYLLAMWLIFFFTMAFSHTLGIIPRTHLGAVGILTSPFFHTDFYHILANSIGFVLFSLIYYCIDGEGVHFLFWSIAIGSGVGTWIFSSEGNYIGASSLVLGLLSYLCSIGFLIKKWKYMALSLFILATYGWVLFGWIPSAFGKVSFEGHIFGFMAGILLAKLRGWNDNCSHLST